MAQQRENWFVSDLHGSLRRYEALFEALKREKPRRLFIGGDLFAMGLQAVGDRGREIEDFANDIFRAGFQALREELGEDAPHVYLILGNDDGKGPEPFLRQGEEEGLWHYVHGRTVDCGELTITGYAYVPPTPFQWKDWEKYDVSRYVDPGCISPEEGFRSEEVDPLALRYDTIKSDLEKLAEGVDMTRSLWLFHSPPYKTNLDRAALDGKMIDHVPLDVHVGSIAIQRFIEERQPLLTLHGHIHESAGITGSWRDRLGETEMFSAAHDGEELAVVRFRAEDLASAKRDLLG